MEVKPKGKYHIKRWLRSNRVRFYCGITKLAGGGDYVDLYTCDSRGRRTGTRETDLPLCEECRAGFSAGGQLTDCQQRVDS